MSLEPFQLTLWIIIVSMIVIAYIISLLLSREEKIVKAPPEYHVRESSILHREKLEDVKLESEINKGKEPYRRSRKEVEEDKLIESSSKESSDVEVKDEGKKEVSDEIKEVKTIEHNVEEHKIEEPNLEIIIEEDGKMELGEFKKTAEELRNELYKLRKILEGEKIIQ